ncbi:MAG: cytochrome c1 [Rhizobiaceae bacterium]|jgi:ubiquinol-cytochrome c reductase cytochrome c1 subunit|nr:cytochrome c1 [Rhizobiaceae bacterium]
MKLQFPRIAGLALAALLTMGTGSAFAAGAEHYPIKEPKHVDWSFSGPMGTWDLGQLQRGYKVYAEVCAACHSIDLVAFRNLGELGFSEAQVKAIAAEFEVEDGPNSDGEMFDRTAVPADKIPGPYANSQEAAVANNGAVPPDFSLLAKARAPERGFPNFVFDIFTMYAENGPDYIYSLLTGYEEAPEGREIPEGTHYNPYFIAGPALAMASPLSDGIVSYDDGSPETLDQYSKDVSAFMMWAAEPSLDERKSLGFRVMIFLLIFSVLLYLTKKKVFQSLKK